jgi:tetratricopeptide (TPR) repeat protein
MDEQYERQQALDRLDRRADEAVSLRENGQHDKAERCRKQIVQDNIRLRGAEDRATLKAKGELAWKLWYLGRHDEAVGKLKRLLVVYRRDFGWDDVDTLDLAEKLFKAYVFRNKEDKSIALAVQFLPHADHVYGEDSARFRTTKETLASIFHGRCDFAKAAGMRKHILESVLRKDEDPVRMAHAFWVYGQTLLEQGEFGESEHHLSQAVALSMDVDVPKHHETLVYQSTLAELNRRRTDLGNSDVAARTGAEVLRKSKKYCSSERRVGSGMQRQGEVPTDEEPDSHTARCCY